MIPEIPQPELKKDPERQKSKLEDAYKECQELKSDAETFSDGNLKVKLLTALALASEHLMTFTADGLDPTCDDARRYLMRRPIQNTLSEAQRLLQEVIFDPALEKLSKSVVTSSTIEKKCIVALGKAKAFGDKRLKADDVAAYLGYESDSTYIKETLSKLKKNHVVDNTYRNDRTPGHFLTEKGRKIFSSLST